MKWLVQRRDVAHSLLVTGLLLLIDPLAHAEEMTWERLQTQYPPANENDIMGWKERGFRPPQVAKWVDQFGSQEFIKTLGNEGERLWVAELLSWMELPIDRWGITVKIILKAMKQDIHPFAFMLDVDPDSLEEKLASSPLPITGTFLLRLREAGYSPGQSRLLIQTCNRLVHHNTFVANPNVYAHKDKCTYVQAVVEQMTASNEGLFKIYGTPISETSQRILLTFDKPFTGQGVRGLARIEGNYTYTSQAGWQITVPHLRMIAELHSPPPEKDSEATGTSE